MGFFLVLGVVLIIAVGVAYIRQRGGAFNGSRELFVVFPTEGFGEGVPANDLDFIRKLELPDQMGPAPEKPRARPIHEAPPTPVVPTAGGRFGNRGAAPVVAPEPAQAPAASPNGYGDPTLQLLPGRLEVLSGMEGTALRFIKQPGAVQELTLGRTKPQDPTHIQIPSPTVSRLHAKLKFQNGTWTIQNLSETNPVAVNGRAATGEGAECILSDGDRIEMGEVSLLFRKR